MGKNKMDKPIILLINPPSRHITIRDNYCSKVSQASYINHPVDLLLQSGFLDTCFDIKLMDCVVDKISSTEALKQIKSIAPVGVYCLAGNAAWDEDSVFLKDLRDILPSSKIVAGGDIFLEDPIQCLNKMIFLDAIVLDFTTNSLSQFFAGNCKTISGIVYRKNSQIIDTRMPPAKGDRFEIPVPRHDLFYRKNYRYPFILRKPFATVMTEYGCPYNCAFCVMGTLGQKLRPVENVLDELRYIINLGIRDVFFVDQSFGNQKDRALELCQAIESEFPRLRWVCFSRVDLIDEILLRKMKQAGCHTIIFGVESADEKILEQYRKGYTLERVRRVFSLMRILKMRSVATFLLGLPGETWDSACATIEFAKQLNCDFASLNVAVPRMGTDLRKWSVEKGYVAKESRQFDQSGSEVIMETESLSKKQLALLKKKAVREIYLRPGYLFKRLISIRSCSELKIHASEGYHLFKNFMFNNPNQD